MKTRLGFAIAALLAIILSACAPSLTQQDLQGTIEISIALTALAQTAAAPVATTAAPVIATVEPTPNLQFQLQLKHRLGQKWFTWTFSETPRLRSAVEWWSPLSSITAPLLITKNCQHHH